MAATKYDIRFTVKAERSRYGGEYDIFTGHVTYMDKPTEWNASGIRNPIDRVCPHRFDSGAQRYGPLTVAVLHPLWLYSICYRRTPSSTGR